MSARFLHLACQGGNSPLSPSVSCGTAGSETPVVLGFLKLRSENEGNDPLHRNGCNRTEWTSERAPEAFVVRRSTVEEP